MENKIIFKIIIIALMVGLAIYIVADSKSLTCDQCTVSLDTINSMPITYNMSDLFNQTKIARCPIYWDRIQGYVKG